MQTYFIEFLEECLHGLSSRKLIIYEYKIDWKAKDLLHTTVASKRQ